MNQDERRKYLIGQLLKEDSRYKRIQMPSEQDEQQQLLRCLMNVRFAAPISEEFASVQDAYLTEVNADMKQSIGDLCRSV